MKRIIFIIWLLPVLIFCQNNFPEGELIEGFENLDDWTLDGIEVYDSIDNNFIEGFYSIKLGSLASERSAMIKSISLDFNQYETFSIDVYLPDFSDDIAKNIRIEFSSTSNFSSYFSTTIYGGERFYKGWNRLIFSKDDFKSSGSELWSNTMIKIRFSVWVRNSGIMAPGFITFDNFRGYQKKADAVAIITFDDNWRSQMDIGKPILDSLGFKGVHYVIGKTASQTHTDRLHWVDYDSLYYDGWDISSHTYNHDTLTHLNSVELEEAINGMRDTLLARGYSRSADFFAYPYGYFNSEVINKVKEHHKLARCTKDWQYFSHPSGVGDDYYLLKKHSELDTYEQTCLDIDKAIDRGQVIVFLFHDITSIADKFRAIMHYIKAKQDSGLIKVMTMSEYWEYLTEIMDTHETLKQTTLNYLLLQNYPNPFNSYTSITYHLSKSSMMYIKIYNVLGEEITTLFQGFQNAGKHEVNFNASNLPSGIYFYRLEAVDLTLSKKMILLK